MHRQHVWVLKVAFGGFLVAVLGVLFGFGAVRLGWPTGQQVAYWTVAAGVATGSVAIVWGILSIIFRGFRGPPKA